MLKILCFGGGNAVPKVLLSELKKHDIQITSVTSMVDNGGSTGQLRADFNILPPGDIRRHLLALSDAPEWKKELFRFRFGHEQFDGGHRGHNFGNIFIGGLEHVLKDYTKVLEIVHDFLEIKKHHALPATIDKVHVAAILENGGEIIGEDEIDVPQKHDANLKIKEVFLAPKAKAYPPVLLAIKKADIITMGPGDLYSSIIPCFLPQGIKEAMQKTRATKVFICPAMTKLGETQGFSVPDFAREVEKYIGCPLDYVVYNTGVPSKQHLEQYKKEEPLILLPVSFESVPKSKKFIGKDLLADDSVFYEPKKVIGVVVGLVDK